MLHDKINVSLTANNLLFLLLVSLLNSMVTATVMIHDPLKNKMVEISSKNPTCKMYDNRNQIQDMMSRISPKQVYQYETNALHEFMDVCRNYERGSSQSVGFIFPGTKWCGQGTVATSYSDLGEFEMEDSCCREHDHCSSTLAPNECLQNICNTSPFTKSHCSCDVAFRNCLKTLGTETAKTLGTVFFNVAKIMCFNETCNQTQCWQEVHMLPPFLDVRKNINVDTRQNPDLITSLIRSIKELLIKKFENFYNNKFFKTINFNRFF